MAIRAWAAFDGQKETRDGALHEQRADLVDDDVMTRAFDAIFRVSRKILLGVAALVALVVVFFFCWFYADQAQFRAAANPCERACLQDSGGLSGCRADCASHPMTYGPASQQPRP